jgi:glutathione peroxidase
MAIYDHQFNTLSGEPTSLKAYEGQTLLLVNVASKCGLTPQYAGLEALYERLAPKGFAVIGFPCNQFGEQEPGTPDEIQSFCSTNYNVTFPLMEKVEVNGEHRHPLYSELEAHADKEGHTGDIRWNFEKFLISPSGEVVARFSPLVTPEDPELVEAIEHQLGA